AATDPDRALVVELPVIRHEHRMWESLSDDERNKRSKKNFDVFLRKWHHHTHLMVHASLAHDSTPVQAPDTHADNAGGS
ncbi:MAG TPA: hypothetical protein VJN88_06975, partial [Ktedonobacterales bacterium]|nr:hypothetical protein [Ktedonobacterales bacterium]